MKHIFEKSTEIMQRNNKTESDYNTMINVNLPRYGIVTPYVEPHVKQDAQILDGDVSAVTGSIGGSMNDVEREKLNNRLSAALLDVAAANERVKLFKDELFKYQPLIDTFNSMAAYDKEQVKVLTERLEDAETAKIELKEFKPLIDVFKAMSGK